MVFSHTSAYDHVELFHAVLKNVSPKKHLVSQERKETNQSPGETHGHMKLATWTRIVRPQRKPAS